MGQKDKAIWRSFMMGTEPGTKSVIFKIRNMTPVIERLKFYSVDEKITSRIEKPNSQIKQILTAVNEENSFIIPGIIDPRSIPDLEVGELDIEFGDDENELHSLHHNASWAYNSYGRAWNMSTSYILVLESFLRNGNIIDHSLGEEYSFPLEGFLNAAFEVDPTKPCNEEDLDLNFIDS